MPGPRNRPRQFRRKECGMSLADAIFCPLIGNLNCEVVAEKIAKEVFCAERDLDKLIEARYAQMNDGYRDWLYSDKNWDLPEYNAYNVVEQERPKRDARLEVGSEHIQSSDAEIVRLLGMKNFGHDLPIWFGPSCAESGKRVMIISQDPLRDGDGPGGLYLSTPFGLHSKNYRDGTNRPKLMTLVVEALLGAGHVVYVTDYLKLFVNKGGCVADCFPRQVEKSRTFLGKEVKLFNPDVVLVLGEHVGRALVERALPVLVPTVLVEKVPLLGSGVGRWICVAQHPSRINTKRAELVNCLDGSKEGWAQYVPYYVNGVNAALLQKELDNNR